LLFDFINLSFPDPADRFWTPAMLADRIRWSVSSLIVAGPVFLWVSTLTARETRRDPIRRLSKVRRWLTYMTLFLAAGILIGDVIALVYSALGGEFTIRLTLKGLVIAVIVGTIDKAVGGRLKSFIREALRATCAQGRTAASAAFWF
jgi:prepilin signal peptidase PulO-like enzyme (type II secretory pathway)